MKPCTVIFAPIPLRQKPASRGGRSSSSNNFVEIICNSVEIIKNFVEILKNFDEIIGHRNDKARTRWVSPRVRTTLIAARKALGRVHNGFSLPPRSFHSYPLGPLESARGFGCRCGYDVVACGGVHVGCRAFFCAEMAENMLLLLFFLIKSLVFRKKVLLLHSHCRYALRFFRQYAFGGH